MWLAINLQLVVIIINYFVMKNLCIKKISVLLIYVFVPLLFSCKDRSNNETVNIELDYDLSEITYSFSTIGTASGGMG